MIGLDKAFIPSSLFPEILFWSMVIFAVVSMPSPVLPFIMLYFTVTAEFEVKIPSPVFSETILFVSDFKEESINAYKRFSETAEMLNAKINFLYINLPGKSFKSTKQMDEVLFLFFTKAQHPDPIRAIKMVNRYADFSIEGGIYNFSHLCGTDIIAIPTHGRKGISRILHGSISEDVANHSIIPVLTLRI